MAQINVNKRVLENVNSDNIAELLNDIIDAELKKPVEDIDIALVDECVDALLELEMSENNDFRVLIPLVSSKKFLERLNNETSQFKSLNRFARIALVAAILAGSTFTANAAVNAVTGVNVIENIGEAIRMGFEKIGLIPTDDIDFVDSSYNSDDEAVPDIAITTTTTTKATEENNKGGELKTAAASISTADKANTAQAKPAQKIEEIVGIEDDDDEETTVINKKEPVTSTKPIITDDSEKEKSLISLNADLSLVKTDYIYNEEISLDGIRLYAHFDDGSKEAVPLKDCYYTKVYNKNKTADYTIKIIYKTCTLEFEITVRPDEETRGSSIKTDGEYDYLISDKGAYITAYKGSETSLTLNDIEGKKIIGLGAGVFENTSVEELTASNVQKVCDGAFRLCKLLKKCSLPNVEYIGDSAFEGCENLTEFTFCDSIEYIGTSAFRKSGIVIAQIPSKITEIPVGMFDCCNKLREVSLLGDVKEIGKFAFSDCTELEKVYGCGNIERVCDYAFYNDENVNFDAFPSKLKAVGDSAFYLCQKLDIGSLPQSITEIGKSSFAYCTLLTEITIPIGITQIPYEAFCGTGAVSVTIPEGVTQIEDYAFRAIKATKLYLPDSLKKIGNNGIYSPLLREIHFGSGETEIADNALYPSKSVKLYVYEGSSAHQYAVNNSMRFELIAEGGE